MIVYLSLKQIILNQIAVLIRKQSEKGNDDQDRLTKRLNNLQKALEEIKSYHHNSNFKYVIKHFNIELTASEQNEISRLSQLYDDKSGTNKRISTTGFTATRSETIFTGAEEEQYQNFYGSDIDDEKTPRSGNAMKPPQWIHYRGFAHWLKKQSFIKFKKRNDQEKYKKIWNTIIGLNLINGWEKGRIKPQNIIGRYGTSQPYIAVHKCGSKEIVKASLLRLSMTTNRIFRFNIEKEENKMTKSRSRTRRSIDMDNEEDYNTGYQLNANELIQGRNLFNEVTNKDALRIVATMLWDSNLANAVLEELLHNARFSMYGIHAKNIVDKLTTEMNLGTTPSYDNESTPIIDENEEYLQQQQNMVDPNQLHLQQMNNNNNNNKQPQTKDITHGGFDPVGDENVAQFKLPSPQRPVSMQKQKEYARNQYDYGQNVNGNNQNQYQRQQQQQQSQQPQQQTNRVFRGFDTGNNNVNNNNNNNNSYNNNASTFSSNNRSNNASTFASKPKQTKPQQNISNNHNNNNNNNNNNNKLRTGNGNQYESDHARYYQQKQYQQQQHQPQHQHQQQYQQHQQYQQQYKSTPEPIPEEKDLPGDESKPSHKGHSESVVFHDNIRESQIMDHGAESDYDGYNNEDDESGSDDNGIPQNH